MKPFLSYNSGTYSPPINLVLLSECIVCIGLEFIRPAYIGCGLGSLTMGISHLKGCESNSCPVLRLAVSIVPIWSWCPQEFLGSCWSSIYIDPEEVNSSTGEGVFQQLDR